ncbi:Lipoprotein [Cupriavidus necator]
MLPCKLPRTLATTLIAAALLTACGGDDGGGNLSPSATVTPNAQPEQPGKKPDQRPDPVIRCAP